MEVRTDRLLLRELQESDVGDTNAYERLPEVARYVTHDVRTESESLARIRESVALSVEIPRRVFDLGITEHGSETVVGRCGFGIRDHAPLEAMLWYVVHPAHWGNGYAVEAARAMMGVAFDQLGLHRVYVDIDPRNTASVRVAERLGMRLEAHLVENAWIKKEWTDSLIFALLEREWRVRERVG